MKIILNILSGGAAGALLVWMLRGWISVRLKQSIKHEYDKKLEAYRVEINAKVQEISHQYQLDRLRKSLFFDHQRVAFASILSQISIAERRWRGTGGCDGEIMGEAPFEDYDNLKKTYYEHQLFLDQSKSHPWLLLILKY